MIYWIHGEHQEKSSLMKKRRTRSHIIADLSANHVEKQVLLCGYTVERTVHDYGVDLLLYTFTDEGEIENETVSIQLKATDDLPLLKDGQTIAFPVEIADLEYWLGERFPVILIVYDAQRDIAFWVYIQSYFERRPEPNLALVGKTLTIHLNASDVVHTDAVRKFARFKAQVLDQVRGVEHHEE